MTDPDIAYVKGFADARELAARTGGDAAVERELRHNPNAGPLKLRMVRQSIAVPIHALTPDDAGGCP